MGSIAGSDIHVPTQYKLRIHSLQKKTLAIQLVLIACGGCIFGIGVEVRHILRLTKSNYHDLVETFLELMLISGIIQIVSAGFSCFTACWKLVWTMYIAVGVSVSLMLLQLSANIAIFYLMANTADMVNEHIYKAWYDWECAEQGSCHNAFVNYIYYYMIPQLLITTIAIFAQILGIIYLWKFISSMTENKLRIWRSRDLLHNPDSVTTLGGLSNIGIGAGGGGGRKTSVDSIDFIENLLRQRKLSASEISSRTPTTSTLKDKSAAATQQEQVELHRFDFPEPGRVSGSGGCGGGGGVDDGGTSSSANMTPYADHVIIGENPMYCSPIATSNNNNDVFYPDDCSASYNNNNIETEQSNSNL